MSNLLQFCHHADCRFSVNQLGKVSYNFKFSSRFPKRFPFPFQFSHPEKEPFFSHRLVEPRRYPRPSEPRCPVHDMRVNIFCLDCRALGCLLCADDPSAHPNHQVMSLRQASSMLRVGTDTTSRLMCIYIYGLVQERRNSSALALELRLSCTNPSIYNLISAQGDGRFHRIQFRKHLINRLC